MERGNPEGEITSVQHAEFSWRAAPALLAAVTKHMDLALSMAAQADLLVVYFPT